MKLCQYLRLQCLQLFSYRLSPRNTSKFVRFVNLMINDVTYLLDESLSDMSRIRVIELEMEDTASWNAKTPEQKRETEKNLRDLERKATGYNQLGDSTVNLLKIFTAETKRPFMEPEIVDRLAAMLDYNLEALAGTRTSEINVKDKEKYHFRPKQLLSAVVQVYLNLADQGEFVHAVANDGRSYRKELFEKTANICKRASLKSPTEIEQLLLFVYQVEEAKASIQAEEDLGEIPDEFQGAFDLPFETTQSPIRCRSAHGYCHARSRHPSVVSRGSRPVDDQVHPTLRREGSFQ